jgi:uncharacterized phage protein gp47/JayE
MPERDIKTFEDFLNTLKLKIGANTDITDFSEGSDILTLSEAISFFMSYLQTEANKIYDNFSIKKAKGQYLRNRIQDIGMTAKPGVAASDVQKFGRNTPATSDFYIYAGSQVSTQPDVLGNTLDYIVLSDILFPSGAMYVTGLVSCTVTGKIGNTPSGTITNITSQITGIDYTINPVPFINGSEAETDDEIVKRIPIFLNGLKGGVEDSIRSAVLALPGITIAKIASEPGSVTVYVSNQSGSLNAQQVLDVKNAVENNGVAFGIPANIITPSITYSIITFDAEYDGDNYPDVSVIENTLKQSIIDLVTVNSDPKLKIKDIMLLVAQEQGVTNVSNIKIDGEAKDKVVDGFSVIRLASVNSIVINWTKA